MGAFDDDLPAPPAPLRVTERRPIDRLDSTFDGDLADAAER